MSQNRKFRRTHVKVWPPVAPLSFLVVSWLLLSDLVEGQEPKTDSSAAAARIRTANTDERGRIRVNGKLFFPILLYNVPTDPDSLKTFREQGFNTLAITKQEDAPVLLTNGLYAAVHAGGKKIENLDSVLLAIGMDSPALNWKAGLIEKTKADLERIRLLIPNRPVMHAIGYWANEPAGVISNTILPKEKYDDLIRAIDVAAPYLYPVPYQPIRTVGEAVGRAGAATQGHKPVLPILQLFVWDAKDRYPTSAELKCMVYLALIHGADGIGYYSYNYVAGKTGTTIAKEQPALWKAVGQINTEVAAIAAVLCDALPAPFVTLKEGAPDVEFRAGTRGALQLLLLANTAGSPRHVTLKFSEKPNMKLKRLTGGDEVTVQDGQVKLRLDPFEAIALID